MLVTLSACGGGGGGGAPPPSPPSPPPPANQAPVAIAGPPQNVFTTENVTLNGSATDPDGDAVTYAWTLTSKPTGSSAALQGATTAKPTFKADKDGVYELSLVVSDGRLSSAEASTTVTAATQMIGAELSALFDARAGAPTAVQLEWASFDSAVAYRIEEEVGGEFVPIETIAGLKNKVTVKWRAPYVGPTTYRVFAVQAGHEAVLLRSGGASIVQASLPPNLQIAADRSEPFVDLTQLSVSGAPAGSSVRWHFDSSPHPLGSGSPFSWNAAVPTGAHLLSAVVDFGNGVRVNLARRINTSSNGIRVSIGRELRGTIYDVIVSASSSAPIAKIEAWLTGGPVREATAPNYCSEVGCDGGPTRYRFEFPAQAFEGSLSIPTVQVRATDTTGFVSTDSIQLPTLAAPIVQGNPWSGQFVSGTLQVHGVYEDPSGRPSTMVGYLGTTKIFETTSPSHFGFLSLAGVSSGNHTLTVQAGGGTFQWPIIVAKNAPAHSPLYTIDENSKILAVDGNLVLHRDPNQSTGFYVAPTNGGLGVPPFRPLVGELQPAGAGSVFGASKGQGGDCPQTDVCVYRFYPAVVVNISALDPAYGAPASSNVRSAPRTAGNLVVWHNRTAGIPSFFTVYNLSTGLFAAAPTPLSNSEFDFDIEFGPSGLVISYFGATGADPNSPISVFSWNMTTGSTTTLATLPAGSEPGEILTDGDSVAYTYKTSVAGNAETPLVRLPAAGGVATELSRSADLIGLGEGVLAWRESGGAGINGDRVHTVDRGSISLSEKACPDSPQRVSGGFFAFCAADGVYTWNRLTGVSTLRAEGGPFPMFISANHLYFKSGVGIYRVSLN